MITDGGRIMFERYTDRARRSVAVAAEIARSCGSDYVDLEHLLVGLYRSEGVATQVLDDLEFDLDALQAVMLGSTSAPSSGHLPFTGPAKRVLEELSLREALYLGHNYIGTEHLLLALCHYTVPGFPPDVCAQCTRVDVRAAVMRRLGLDNGEVEVGDLGHRVAVRPVPVTNPPSSSYRPWTVDQERAALAVVFDGMSGVDFASMVWGAAKAIRTLRGILEQAHSPEDGTP